MTIADARRQRRGQGRRVRDELLLDILTHAPDAIAIVEVASAVRNKYAFTYVNDIFESVYECTKEEVIGADAVEFMSRRSLPRDIVKTLSLFSEGRALSNTRPLVRSDGATIWLEVNFRPVLAPNRAAHWIFIARDITAKKLLQDRATQLSIAVEEGNDLVAISVADEETRTFHFSYVNEAFTRTTGYLPEELIGQTFALLTPKTPAKRLAAFRSELFAGRPVRDELTFVHKDGREGIFDISVRPIADPITGRYSSVVAIYRDVTQERREGERLQYEAEHDALTGLNNRRYLERMLRDSVAMKASSEPRHALIFLDLDGFKEVNDTLGHEAGDGVLKAGAESFKRCVFGSDVLVRWGGDEFAALLFHCHVASAERIAGCMLEEIRQAPAALGVTASVGVAPVMPGDGPAESVRRADKACYAAKVQGGNRVVAATFPT